MNAPPIPLLPGDTLLYSKSDLFGIITSIKTFSPAVHVEKYEGGGFSLASRNGLGVGRYEVRFNQLCAILRPKQQLDMAAVKDWFNAPFDPRYGTGVKGRPYGWKDLLRFYNIKLKTSGWICSQTAAKIDRIGGLHAFAEEYYEGTIDPGDFFLSPAYEWVWVRPDVKKAVTS